MRPLARITSRQNLRVFDHVTIRVGDLEASRRFYALALGKPAHEGDVFIEWGEFGIALVAPERPQTGRLHAGFAVKGRAEVDAWWRRLTAAGYLSDGAPGPRPEYSESYYGGFVLDPDGNSVEAVHEAKVDPEATVLNHLWLRTRDVAAARAFYLTIASVVGLRVVHDTPDRVRLTDGVGSFTFAAGDQATVHVHLAFGVPANADVASFHRAATMAGYRDSGEPGERPEYHPGYCGAFVLDPDGHNVEAVCHNRPGP
jgi:catechol 2,3-dioxygenase-like lactoylglutathione lyase family enzyme